ncbi:MAG TPA: GyrI-like domain-containing protein [Clostridiaceae bacterium]|jgi:predicted transcriptional regulator YdeE|nr:GyrI-like domain-containing protein [Clostridiaceae bacterium]
MAEIVKCYKEHLPALRLIGKRYTDSDRIGGSFGAKWGEWFQNGWFAEVEKLGPLPENGDAYLGVMRCINGNFEYWIGMFFPTGTTVPEGYAYTDIPEGDIGTCYIYGHEDTGELYGLDAHNACMDEIAKAGWKLQQDPWFFERYNCPRFTTPDEHGKVILDYCVYLA